MSAVRSAGCAAQFNCPLTGSRPFLPQCLNATIAARQVTRRGSWNRIRCGVSQSTIVVTPSACRVDVAARRPPREHGFALVPCNRLGRLWWSCSETTPRTSSRPVDIAFFRVNQPAAPLLDVPSAAACPALTRVHGRVRTTVAWQRLSLVVSPCATSLSSSPWARGSAPCSRTWLFCLRRTRRYATWQRGTVARA